MQRCQRVLVLQADKGTGAEYVLEHLMRAAAARSLSAEVYHCGLDPGTIEHLYVPELSLAVVTSRAPHVYTPTGTWTEDLNALIREERLARWRGEMSGVLADSKQDSEKAVISFRLIDWSLAVVAVVFVAFLVLIGMYYTGSAESSESVIISELAAARPDTSAPALVIGSLVYIENVPLFSQHPRWPTGCEVVSLAKLAGFYGVHKSVDEWIELLPQGPLVWRNGRLHGPDPREMFAGSPHSRQSFGVYHQPLLRMLEPYFGARIINMTKRPWEEYEAMVRAGNPVAVWGTISNLPVRRTDSWVTPQGEVVHWNGNQHVMLLVGFSETSVLVNDPWTGTLRRFDKNAFKQRWKALGRQGIAIGPE
ncbi:MAG: hypothetical protein DDT39_00963 [Firmicutes bacterium]|nr:hypothetical protein [candidate division NPL-UPA2 bacterium]